MSKNGPIHIQIFDTILGPMRLGVVDDGVCLLAFAGSEKRPRMEKRLMRHLGGHLREAAHPLLESARQQLEEYFAGHRRTFDLPLKLAGTAFQRKVWRALMKIPFGQTISYATLARAIGQREAARAVAGANAANAISIIIPCHRVIATGGGLGGYAGGLDAKRRLLTLEGIPV